MNGPLPRLIDETGGLDSELSDDKIVQSGNIRQHRSMFGRIVEFPRFREYLEERDVRS